MTPRKPSRSAALRKAFVRQFGEAEINTATSCPNHQLRLLDAFSAGANWQRRQKKSNKS